MQAILHPVHGVAEVSQAVGQGAAQVRIVFGEQQAHGITLGLHWAGCLDLAQLAARTSARHDGRAEAVRGWS
ncbi:hypothetical protein GCM10028795_16470 [Lysobacter olei]